MREYRMWNPLRNNMEGGYHYDILEVMECLKQQMLFNRNTDHKLGYDHSMDGCVFEQFTGLKDKNGTKIFEGDIVKIDGFEFVVIWSKEAFAFMIATLSDLKNCVPVSWFSDKTDQEMEVIGSIHKSRG